MKKIYSLKSSVKFNKVIKSGKKIKSNYLFISYINADEFKIGISIPKKLGNAILRNKNKRQLKEIISKANIYNIKKHITVVVREKWIKDTLTFEEKQSIFTTEIQKIK